jgi:hypothetical protein
MAESVESFARFVQRCFESGRDEEYAAICALPMIVYSENAGLAVAATGEQLIDMIRGAWDAIRGTGRRIELAVIAVGLPQPPGFPARIDWNFHDGDGRHVDTLEMRYFLSHDEAGRIRVQMIEVYGPGCAKTVSAPPADVA